MTNDKTDTTILKEKILKGLEKAVEKLIKSKKQANGEVVVSRNGRIIRIKAKEI
jgi:hypothetical protein